MATGLFCGIGEEPRSAPGLSLSLVIFYRADFYFLKGPLVRSWSRDTASAAAPASCRTA